MENFDDENNTPQGVNDTLLPILKRVFGEDATDVVAMDDTLEVDISDLATDQKVQADLASLTEGWVSTVSNDKLYAVVSAERPIGKANIVMTREDEVLGIFILAEPVDVPETITDEELCFPIPADGWEVSEGRADPHDINALPKFLNQAELLNDRNHNLDSFLTEQKFTFMLGNLYPNDHRRSTQDGKWKESTGTLMQWLQGDGKSTGLTFHPEGKTKDGASLVPSRNIDGARTDKAVETMYAIGIDIDAVTSLDHVLDKLCEADIFAIVYTTFNHMSEKLELKHDEVMRKLRIDATPTRNQIQEYLRLHHPTPFTREFIEEIEIVDARKQTKNGLIIVLKVPPIDKFRVVIPLAEPVTLADLAPTVQKWKEVWADAVTGVCVNMLDAIFDTASCDVNRLFYTPRHPKGDENWYSAIVMGKPLHFDDIEPYPTDKYKKDCKPTGDPFDAGTDDIGQREEFFAPSGMSLNDWNRRAKHRYEFADMIETECADKLRFAGGERAGTVHLECPFEHYHTEAGGTATMAMNPEVQEHGVWTIFCRHDSCAGRDKLEFLQEMLEQEWFDEAVLTDETFLLPGDDDDEEDGEDKPERTLEHVYEDTNISPEFNFVTEAEKLPDDISEEALREFMLLCHKHGADKVDRGHIKEIIASKTPLTKTQIASMWKAIDREEQAEESRKALEDLDNFDGYPIVNVWDFKKMVKWGKRRLNVLNKKDPFLFTYMTKTARIRDDLNGAGQIHTLTKDEFAVELNKHTTWNYQTPSGDSVTKRGVPAPKDVVTQIFDDVDAQYLPLRGVVTAPFFTKDGTLVTEPGYHEEAQVYYQPPDNFDLPKVSRKPSDKDVADALETLVVEVFGDFPLDALTRGEIENRCQKDGEGVASVANIIAMLLMYFCRDMIDGPTPIHLFNKPDKGTGASLITDLCALTGVGIESEATTMPTSKVELQKTISALMQEGPSMICFDNVAHSVDSAEFASAVTVPIYKARILGKTQLVKVPVRNLWAITAIALDMSAELLRRSVLIDMDANDPEPEKRTGWRHDKIRTWVKEHRPELVHACLTIVQNWIAQGKPAYTGGKIMGSFEEYVSVMGGILEAAGLKGFLENQDELKEEVSDGKADALGLFLNQVAAKGDGSCFRAGESSGKIHGLMEIANAGCDETDFKPIIVNGLGYETINGEDQFPNAIKFGLRFKKVAAKPHIVWVKGAKKVLRFQDGKDRENKTIYTISLEDYQKDKPEDKMAA